MTTLSGAEPHFSPAELVRRELVERQAPAEHLADDRNLLRVTLGRRAREDVVSAGERRFGERAHRHGGDVALVDRRRLDRAVRPSDHVACANLRRPPVERVRREPSRRQGTFAE